MVFLRSRAFPLGQVIKRPGLEARLSWTPPDSALGFAQVLKALVRHGLDERKALNRLAQPAGW